MDSRKILRTLTKMKMMQSDNVLHVGGFSMIPLLVAGDNIRIKEQDKYQVGDIVVCVAEKPGSASLVVHRIIYIRRKEGKLFYITKGDNAIAAENIESDFCLGKVIEITNKNGKRITVNTPSENDTEIVRLSREVYSLYKKTGDPTIAFSSAPHMEIYDRAPDYLKEHVFASQKEMIKRASELIRGDEPSPPTPGFEFTRDFYASLAFHRVMNVLEPYVMEGSGRFGKHIKLSKARNLMAARRRLKKAGEIADAFDTAGISYIIFKGIAASHFIFGDPNIRECDDVDFLILPEEVQRAHNILGELGYSYHDERGFYRTETPEEHYHTHLEPYIHETDCNTVELHTAIFTQEKYTAEVLANRKQIEIDGQRFFVLRDIEMFICQLFITAVDDYGTANMTYEMDPNIFLQLKFRNYLDIAFMGKKYSNLSPEEIIETAMKYNVNFQMFFALDFTCKVFDNADFTEFLRLLRDRFKANEQLEESMYYLPVGIQDCLRSPFKMKMNGRALCYLRDCYNFSSHWRRVQKRIEKGDFLEMKPKEVYEYVKDGVTQRIKKSAIGVIADLEINTEKRTDEFIVVFKRLLEEKCKKPGDYAYDVRFLYINKSEGYLRKGKIMQNMNLASDEFTEHVMNYVRKTGKKLNFSLHLGKKQRFGKQCEMTAAKAKFYFKKSTFLPKNGANFMVFSTVVLDLKDTKLQTENFVNQNNEDILKISFD